MAKLLKASLLMIALVAPSLSCAGDAEDETARKQATTKIVGCLTKSESSYDVVTCARETIEACRVATDWSNMSTAACYNSSFAELRLIQARLRAKSRGTAIGPYLAQADEVLGPYAEAACRWPEIVYRGGTYASSLPGECAWLLLVQHVHRTNFAVESYDQNGNNAESSGLKR